MNGELWTRLGILAGAAALLAGASLSARPGARMHRWTRRIFWAPALLWASGMLGGAGLNPVNLLAVTGLGGPGYLAVWALTLF